MNPLGRLERVDLRTVWENEATDFTPWLAEDANVQLLGETIGLELEVEAREKDVGPFRADILCRDVLSDSSVLVENQLERTDHRHLGQLITYAAGLDAVSVVWIAERFTEEHRAALDWLNEVTGSELNFFGLEVELWRIGDSRVAPKFNVVAKPNEWTKQGGPARRVGLSDFESLQLQFWEDVHSSVAERDASIRGRAPKASWVNVWPIGRRGFHIYTFVNSRENRLGCVLACDGPNATAHFDLLKHQRAEIEADVGVGLEWNELPDKQRSTIRVVRDGFDLHDADVWPDAVEWLVNLLVDFHGAFTPRVRALAVDAR